MVINNNFRSFCAEHPWDSTKKNKSNLKKII